VNKIYFLVKQVLTMPVQGTPLVSDGANGLVFDANTFSNRFGAYSVNPPINVTLASYTTIPFLQTDHTNTDINHTAGGIDTITQAGNYQFTFQGYGGFSVGQRIEVRLEKDGVTFSDGIYGDVTIPGSYAISLTGYVAATPGEQIRVSCRILSALPSSVTLSGRLFTKKL